MARSIFGTIQKTASGRWRGRYRKNGHTIYTPTMRTKTEVRHLLDQAHAEITLGTWQAPAQKKRATITLDEYADQWIETQGATGASPNTIRARRSALKVHIRPLLGAKPLADITDDDAHQVYTTALERVSKASARNVLLCLSALMNAAVQQKIINTNPVKVAGAFTRQRPMRPKIALTVTQMDDLIATVPGRYRLGVLAMSYGALRYGEVSALTVADIDLEQVTVQVNKAVKRGPDGGMVVGPPKTEAAYRVVALPARFKEVLATHLRLYAGEDGRLFFDEGTRSGYMSNVRWNNIIGEALEAAKLPDGVRCHDLRHSGLTWYGQQGATLADLMARAGHTDAKTVIVYQHSSARRDRELVDRA